MRTAIALTVSDLHLSHKPPISRSTEPDWYKAQKRVLDQIGTIAEEHDVPIIYAGDIFDKPTQPVRMVNFAMINVPTGYAIPGQHDLPGHSLKRKMESAYGSLCINGNLIDLDQKEPMTYYEGIAIHAFPWSESSGISTRARIPNRLNLAVLHRYTWKPDHGYPGAEVSCLASQQAKILRRFSDVAVFGDNHKGFIWKNKGFTICNNGAAILRTIDQIDYEPCVSLIFDDGSVVRHALDTSEDVWIDRKAVRRMKKQADEIREFASQITGITSDTLDFVKIVQEACRSEGVEPEIRQIIQEAIREYKSDG